MAGTFGNTVSAQTGSLPSMQPMTQGSPGEAVSSGILAGASLFSDIKTKEQKELAALQPTQTQIDRGEMDYGRKRALQQVAQYEQIAATKGETAARMWRRRTSLETQMNLKGKEIDGYRDTWDNMLGGYIEKAEEEALQSAHAASIKKEEELRVARVEAGALFASMSPDYQGKSLSETDLENLGRFYQARKEAMDYEKAKNELALSNMNVQKTERELISEDVFDETFINIQASIAGAMLKLKDTMATDPSQVPAHKAQVIGELTQLRSSIDSQLASAMKAAGGSLTDVPVDRLNAVRASIDNRIALIRGDYMVDLNNTNVNLMVSGAQADYLDNPKNHKTGVVAAINSIAPNTIGVGSDFVNIDLTRTQQSVNRVYSTLDFGTAGGIVREGLDDNTQVVKDIYKNAGVGVWKLSASERPDYRESAANTLVSSIMEAASGPRKQREVAMGPSGVRVLINEAVKSKRGAISQEIVQAARNEGMSPEELFGTYLSRFSREVLIPNLRMADPEFFQFVSPSASGDSLEFVFDEQAYRQHLDPSGTMTGEGQVAFDRTVRELREQLRKAQAEFNKLLNSYSHMMDASKDDTAYVMSLALKDTWVLLGGDKAVEQELNRR